jgi:hypothetical protein
MKLAARVDGARRAAPAKLTCVSCFGTTLGEGGDREASDRQEGDPRDRHQGLGGEGLG